MITDTGRPARVWQHPGMLIRTLALGCCVAGATLSSGCPTTAGSDAAPDPDAPDGRRPPDAPMDVGEMDVGGGDVGTDGGLDAADTGVDAASSDAPDAMIEPCTVELCELGGTDDDCDGMVDEGCDCEPGTASPCFLGDATYRGTPGCFDGTMWCGDDRRFGACTGGRHATEMCFDTTLGCHGIRAAAPSVVDLRDGTGVFSTGAIAGTERWTVRCPPSVHCPAPGPAPHRFHAIQSGEYEVTYAREVVAGVVESCDYPLLVGSPGLRVELSWEAATAPSEIADLDLHLHRPADTSPWGLRSSRSADCGWANCTVNAFVPGPGGAEWFSAGVLPDPVSWLDRPGQNTCYDAPLGAGTTWQSAARGCHSPRLETERIGCDASVADPDDSQFCHAEIAAVDVPPTSDWFRIGVHYHSAAGVVRDVHPTVRVLCDGALFAELGPRGFGVPPTPVAFAPVDGSGAGGHRFWLVADVAVRPDSGGVRCVVRPLFADAALRSPSLTTDVVADASFGPAYPAP